MQSCVRMKIKKVFMDQGREKRFDRFGKYHDKKQKTDIQKHSEEGCRHRPVRTDDMLRFRFLIFDRDGTGDCGSGRFYRLEKCIRQMVLLRERQ